MTEYCAVHSIPQGAICIDDIYVPSEDELDQVTKYLKEHNYNVKYGDLIELTEYSGYRNTGIFIFDGTKVIDLESDYDDYGALPRIFKVLQKNEYGFTPSLFYWHNPLGKGISHNNIVWFDHYDYIDEIKKNITCDGLLSNGKNIYTWFNLVDTNEIIYIVLDEWLEEDDKTENTINLLKTWLINKLDTREQVQFTTITFDFDEDKNKENKKVLFLHYDSRENDIE